MTLKNTNSCMFIGLPESGKSSFIGALWHVVESGEIQSSFTVQTQPEDRSYLNQLRNNFLNCKANERTKIENIKKIDLKIISSSTGKVVDFVFPDLDGEIYSTQFESRQLTKDYDDVIGNCQSLMLFINPDTLKRPVLIPDAEGMMSFLIDFASTAPLTEVENSTNADLGNQSHISSEDAIFAKNLAKLDNAREIKWNPKLSQTQVVLVDLLQMIFERLEKPCRIGVVISAWDVIKKSSEPQISNASPEQWVKDNLPLLFQYLRTKGQTLPSKYFGISAQGGAYSLIPDENIELQRISRPSERLIIQEGKSISNDISIPLKWLFE